MKDTGYLNAVEQPLVDGRADAACVADAMAAGCEYLDRAAIAEEEGNDERAETYREDAEDEFAECDLLADEFGIGG